MTGEREGPGTAGPDVMVRCVWECKVGARMLDINLPDGADAPMRRAVRQAFVDITGTNPEFCFSGWGGKLSEPELAVVENRVPSAAYEADWYLRNAARDMLATLREIAGLPDKPPYSPRELRILKTARAAIALAEGR